MIPWLKRAIILVLLVAVVRWILNARDRHDRVRSGVAPTIGGDTWPPVPVNPAAGS